METKQIVLLGLVATALLTAIVLSGWMAEIIIAFLILSGGIILTYFIALNQKRIQQSGYLTDLIKAGQQIGQQNNIEAAMGKLAEWSRGLLNIERALVVVPGEDGFQAGDTSLSPFVIALNHQLEVSNGGREFHKGENDDINWPKGVVWMAIYPLINLNEHQALLLLADSSPRELNPKNRETLDILGQQSIARLSRWQVESKRQQDDKVLITSLLAGMEACNPIFLGHSQRVYTISLLIASKLGLEEEESTALGYAAWLHDIGKGAEAALSQSEEEEASPVRDHASQGADLIPDQGIFKLVRKAVRHHHERYDGSGYPCGLTRTEIPFIARIIAVADVYDALTRLCPEEERITHSTAIRIIQKGTGTLFDPLVVVALEEVEQEVELRVNTKIITLYEDTYAPFDRY